MPRCPVCDAPIDLDRTPTAPFCTERCQKIDLGRWLDESYALPEPRRHDAEDEDGDGQPPPADED